MNGDLNPVMSYPPLAIHLVEVKRVHQSLGFIKIGHGENSFPLAHTQLSVMPSALCHVGNAYRQNESFLPPGRPLQSQLKSIPHALPPP